MGGSVGRETESHEYDVADGGRVACEGEKEGDGLRGVSSGGWCSGGLRALNYMGYTSLHIAFASL